MTIDAWFPIGFKFPDDNKAKMVVREGTDWQIYNTEAKSRSLLVKEDLGNRWLQSNLVEHLSRKKILVAALKKRQAFFYKTISKLKLGADSRVKENLALVCFCGERIIGRRVLGS